MEDTTYPTREPGIDLKGLDRSVRPQDDFYRFVNGAWLDRTPIPSDYATYGAFHEVFEAAERGLRVIIEEAAAACDAPGSDAQKVGDFYRSYMDEARADALGLSPLADELSRIDGIRTLGGVITQMARHLVLGADPPLHALVDQDAKHSDRYIVYFTQGGIGLPDRDYYLLEDPKFAEIRVAYEAYIATILRLIGVESPDGAAARIVALEKRIAEHHWTQVENRDEEARYNRVDMSGLGALAPRFDWSAYLAGAGAAGQTETVVSQPSFVRGFGALLAEVPVETWRVYLKWHLVNAYAPYLSRDFVDARFDFYGKTLSGIDEIRPRWKRAVGEIDESLGEVLGRMYVERHFPPEAKARMNELVENLKLAFRESIETLDWMGPETRRRALIKLGQFTTKIGYPDVWRDYAGLVVTPDDLVGNVMRARSFEHERRFGHLGKPVDRNEWQMTPQTVNAYYNPLMNEIVFPAAILQPPFFDMNADDAANYGGIGAVIGHEIGHGFDDQGRKFDGDGNLTDWWTEADAREFDARAKKLVEQFGAYNPIDDMHINGELTLGENIGDLGGLNVAYRAYRISLRGREAPVIGGFTGDQRFFMGWAQVWRGKYKDEELRNRLLTDPHSPPGYRVTGPMSNMDEFYAAYGVKEGDALHRPAGDRVRIW